MKTKNFSFNNTINTPFKILVVLTLILGIFFRFTNIDQKIYWSDESFTSLRVSGYTEVELLKQDFQGNPISIEEFQKKYQNINSDKGLVDTISGLSQEEAQLPPLYFSLLRVWAQLFGSSVWTIRAFSVVISILVIGFTYLLSLELFESHFAGQLSILIMSLSPFQLVFAQEARPYSLWTLMIVSSSLALLRALRLQNRLSWLIYSFTIVLSLYSFLFSWFVIIGHGIYVFTIERFRLSKTVSTYLRSSILGILFFIPWVVAIIFNVHRSYKGVSWLTLIPNIPLFQRWAINIGRSFVDFGLSMSDPLTLFYSLPIVILVVYSLYFCWLNASRKTSLFVIISTFFMLIVLGIPDIVLGGQRSATCRYMIPLYIGSQLSVIYFFSSTISSNLTSNTTSNLIGFWQKKICQFTLVSLVSLSIASCVSIIQSDTWWNKGFEELYTPSVIAQSANQKTINELNNFKDVLIISDGDSGSIMSLSHRLSQSTSLLLVVQPNKPLNIPDRFSNIFLFSPSKTLRDWFTNKTFNGIKYKLEPIKNYGDSDFWRLLK
jgi:uncharacterized membrane protein